MIHRLGERERDRDRQRERQTEKLQIQKTGRELTKQNTKQRIKRSIISPGHNREDTCSATRQESWVLYHHA